MASTPVQTITVDRISNSGNAIAQQQQSGKTIHIPAGEVGESYDVRLIDQGGYFTARLVDRTEEIQPRQPGIGPDASDVGKDLLEPRQKSSHSFTVRPTVSGGRLRSTPSSSGQAMRRKLSRRKK